MHRAASKAPVSLIVLVLKQHSVNHCRFVIQVGMDCAWCGIGHNVVEERKYLCQHIIMIGIDPSMRKVDDDFHHLPSHVLAVICLYEWDRKSSLCLHEYGFYYMRVWAVALGL
jgi:hypothetical protein